MAHILVKHKENTILKILFVNLLLVAKKEEGKMICCQSLIIKCRNQTIKITILIIFIIRYNLIAQTPTNFKGIDYLPDNHVLSFLEIVLGEDSSHLWVGTEGGLARYDGTNWIEFTEDNSELSDNQVNAILKDIDGHLWFGTEDGINVFDGESWKSYTHDQMPSKLGAKHITSLFLDSKNNIWVGTRGITFQCGGVTKISPDRQQWVIYDAGTSGIINDHITAINEDSQGFLWFGTQDSGICRFDGKESWTSYQQVADLGKKIKVIFKDHNDTLWIGTDKGVIRTYNGTQWIPCYLPTNHPLPAVISIAEDREYNLWFGTENDGLYKYDRISCYKTQIDELLNIPSISSMILDQPGNLWLGTKGDGIWRLSLNWQTFNKYNSELVYHTITGIDEDVNGNLWIATLRRGIAKFDGVTFDTINVNGMSEGTNYVNSILVDRENLIWCATYNGVHHFNGVPPWTSYHEPILASDTVFAIAQTQDGVYWFGTRKGVSRFDKLSGTWTTIDTSNGLPDLLVTSIYEDELGHLWFGTLKGGICEFSDDSITAIYNTSNGLSDNHVNAIIQEENGAYWIGTKSGISVSRFDGIEWKYFTRENSGLIHNHVRCMFKDSRQNIWVGTFGGGLCKFDGQFWWDYNKHISSNQIYAITEDVNQNLWFGTDSGLVKYCPDKTAPKTFITITPASRVGVASALFVFSGTDTETPAEKLVYSWALQDSFNRYIHNWSAIIQNNYCEVTFPLDGYYIFSVRAIDGDGNIDPSPARFHLLVDITPPTAVINYPGNNDAITGEIPIIGTVVDNSLIGDFKYFWLNYVEAKGRSIESIPDSVWYRSIVQYNDRDTISNEIKNDTLLVWNTDSLNGLYFLRLSAVDSLGHISHYPVQVQIVEALKNISNRWGGTIQNLKNKVTLFIPPGALEKDMVIHLNPVDVSQIPTPQSDQLRYSSMAYIVGPDSLILKKPATLTFYYENSDFSDFDEKKLSLLFTKFDITKRNQKYLLPEDYTLHGGVVDLQNNKIQTTTKESGTYILIEDHTIKQGYSNIDEINCQPRIFSPTGNDFSETTNISFHLVGDSNITIKIYNLAGRLVRIISNEPMCSGNKSLPWDGRDNNGNICPSDLYLVTIESEKEIKTKTVMILDKSKN